MAAGTWFIEDLSPDYVVEDGTPIFEGEPIAVLKELMVEDYQRLYQLNMAISIASNVLYSRMLAKLPVYAPLSQLAFPWNDFIKAGAAGGLDGVLNDVGGEVKLDVGIPIMDLNGFKYLHEFNSSSKGAIIRMRDRLDAGDLRRALMEFIYPVNPDAVILLETSIDALRRHSKEVESMRDSIDGVLLYSLPLTSRLVVSPPRRGNMYRCRSCYVDYESETPLKKCPKCQGRLVPLLRSQSSSTGPDKLRARALANLKYLRNEAAQVVPARWFTFKGA
ncbi:hypothetical protein GCM10007981_06860 [Thermocladium modestius]|uniref:Uncharacterized protein n=1 Tax=Thermocladium modestius TaxID=62609 RepID=A0A830GTY4_9CREN|nr:hypothetical protein GCM10007981_06860 [Thermocladium modestius]